MFGRNPNPAGIPNVIVSSRRTADEHQLFLYGTTQDGTEELIGAAYLDEGYFLAGLDLGIVGKTPEHARFDIARHVDAYFGASSSNRTYTGPMYIWDKGEVYWSQSGLTRYQQYRKDHKAAEDLADKERRAYSVGTQARHITLWEPWLEDHINPKKAHLDEVDLIANLMAAGEIPFYDDNF